MWTRIDTTSDDIVITRTDAMALGSRQVVLRNTTIDRGLGGGICESMVVLEGMRLVEGGCSERAKIIPFTGTSRGGIK